MKEVFNTANMCTRNYFVFKGIVNELLDSLCGELGDYKQLVSAQTTLICWYLTAVCCVFHSVHVLHVYVSFASSVHCSVFKRSRSRCLRSWR